MTASSSNNSDALFINFFFAFRCYSIVLCISFLSIQYFRIIFIFPPKTFDYRLLVNLTISILETFCKICLHPYSMNNFKDKTCTITFYPIPYRIFPIHSDRVLSYIAIQKIMLILYSWM